MRPHLVPRGWRSPAFSGPPRFAEAFPATGRCRDRAAFQNQISPFMDEGWAGHRHAVARFNFRAQELLDGWLEFRGFFRRGDALLGDCLWLRCAVSVCASASCAQPVFATSKASIAMAAAIPADRPCVRSRAAVARERAGLLDRRSGEGSKVVITPAGCMRRRRYRRDARSQRVFEKSGSRAFGSVTGDAETRRRLIACPPALVRRRRFHLGRDGCPSRPKSVGQQVRARPLKRCPSFKITKKEAAGRTCRQLLFVDILPLTQLTAAAQSPTSTRLMTRSSPFLV